MQRRSSLMRNLEEVIRRLKALGPDFFGEVKVKVKDGSAVHMSEERSIKLSDDEPTVPAGAKR
jgi:hypothetical protein